MSLSDEVLSRQGHLGRIREVLAGLVADLPAQAAFLVDEAGVPFATIGHVRFQYPHPLAALAAEPSSTAILEALTGEPQEGEVSCFLSHRACPRALVAVVLENPVRGRKRRVARARIRRAANDLRPLLEPASSSL